MTTQTTVGVDVGGTTVKCGLVDTQGTILHRYTCDTQADAGPDRVLQNIADAIRTLLASAPDSADANPAQTPRAIGLGVPGVVNHLGQFRYPPNFPGWQVVHVADRLRELLQYPGPIAAENDANVAALAEARTGGADSPQNFLFVTLGTGVGGCIVYHGAIWRGAEGGAGEVGHVSVDMNGRPCNCGSRGCVEAYAGQRMITAITAERLPAEPNSQLHAMIAAGHTLEPLLIDQAANAGDAFARGILEETGEVIGAGLASAVNLCDLHTVIIGGGTAGSQILFQAIERSVKNRVLRSIADIRIQHARHGNDAGIIGAAMMMMD